METIEMPQRCWVTEDDIRYFTHTTTPSSMLRATIPPGVYEIMIGAGQWGLKTLTLKAEPLVEDDEGPTFDIFKYIEKFLDPAVEAKFHRNSMIYRRGILLHGKPGTGKTYTIYRLCKLAVERGLIVLYRPNPKGIELLYNYLQATGVTDQKIVVIWEEFDNFVMGDSIDPSMLQLLDGAKTLEGIIYLATTNYIDRIPDNIKLRPSRFQRVVEIGPPNASVREAFLRKRLAVEDHHLIPSLVKWSDGMVLDGVKTLAESVICMDEDIAIVGQTIREHLKLDVFTEPAEEA